MTKPNIVLILIDDMGGRDLGCYGSSFYETPWIDRLAREGVRFTDAYAACPVCSPSRASLLSGKYPARVGVTDWIGAHTQGKLIDAPYTDHLPLSEVTLAQALREGGYQTWHVGKWHLGEKPYWPEKQGFDINIGGCQWGHPKGGYFSPYGNPNLPDGPEGEYLTDRITDEAIALLRNRGEKPFFLNLWHYAVHNPMEAPEGLVGKYRKKLQALGLREDEFEEGDFYPCEHKKSERIVRRRAQTNPVYAAMVQNLDDNIGRLYQELDRQGLLDDTLILFTSDNGGLSTSEGAPTCNYPLAEGKGWCYEGGVREPLIARWPGVIEPGSECGALVSSPDYYPTLLDVAGLPLRPEQHVDGKSFLPALKGEPFDRGAIYWHYPHYGNQGATPASAVREGEWKLVHLWEDGSDALYRISIDVSETRDVSKAEPEIAKRLRGKLDMWLSDCGAKIPEENPSYQPWPERSNGRPVWEKGCEPWD